jgi:hypothetical protein
MLDEDGVLFYLGTKGGRQGYGNPGEEGGLVKCTWSSECDGEPSRFVDHKSGRGGSYTASHPNSFMSVDLQLCRVSNMTKYVLRHGNVGGGNGRGTQVIDLTESPSPASSAPHTGHRPEVKDNDDGGGWSVQLKFNLSVQQPRLASLRGTSICFSVKKVYVFDAEI